MNYMEYFSTDFLNGPGVRTSLFVSGCTHNCPGCFSKATHDFEAGYAFTNKTKKQILASLMDKSVRKRGLSLLGGDPLNPKNVETLRRFVRLVKRLSPKSDIWIWTGFLYESLSPMQWGLAKLADVLVDGPFVKGLKSSKHPFRGSSNQRLIDIKQSLAKGGKSPILWEP